MAQVEVLAERIDLGGSAESRRLRRGGRVPAVVYGHGADTLAISVNARDIRNALSNRVVKGALLSLVIDGKKQLAKVQDVQKHPVKRELTHIDFQSLSASELVTASVNLIAGEGVDLLVPALDISGPASAIPNSLEITLAMLGEEGTLTAAEIKLGGKLELISDGATVVASATIED